MRSEYHCLASRTTPPTLSVAGKACGDGKAARQPRASQELAASHDSVSSKWARTYSPVETISLVDVSSLPQPVLHKYLHIHVAQPPFLSSTTSTISSQEICPMRKTLNVESEALGLPLIFTSYLPCDLRQTTHPL